MKTSTYLIVSAVLALSFAVPAFAHAQVACTQEAMQCPDGSWVGRSGPNCQFICPGTPAPTVPSYYQPAQMCPQLSYNLYRGLSDYYTAGQVSQLQQFLGNYFASEPVPVTGYYGSITTNFVARFQQAQGVYPITGGVGPLTRAAIARSCGTIIPGPVYPPTYGSISITNVSGPNSLAVGSSGTWSITTNAPYGTYLSVNVSWGDEAMYPYPMSPSAGYVSQQNTFSHTYYQAGTYTVTFTVTDNAGRATSANATVVVGGGTGCGTYYGTCPPPVTAPTLTSLSPTQGPVGTAVTIYGSGFTQDNRVHFGSGGAVHVPSYSNGTVLYFTIPSVVGPCDWVGDTSPIRCLVAGQQVVPGQYQMSVENENGQSGVQSFTVTGTTGTGGVSAYPQSGYAPLTVTFSINNYSGQYSADFGDGTSATLQSGSVTHTYYSRGAFTAQFSSDSQCLHSTPACKIAVRSLGSATITVY